MNYLISGGGTGGHIYPALSIIKEIQRVDASAKILYAGTPDGIEKELTSRENIDYTPIRVKGMPRNLSMESLESAVELIKGLLDANKVIKKFKPDVVIGTGGYVSFPVMYVAQLKKIKTVIQEQNAYPGKANKILGKKADKIAIAFDDARKYFSNDKCFLSGNPIREDFKNLNKLSSRDKYKLLEDDKLVVSFGGSGGQKSINKAVLSIMEKPDECDYKLIHITGKAHYDEFLNDMKKMGIIDHEKFTILDYSHDIPELLMAADLAILSSSAISLAEISYLGIPSILIPKRYTAENHQEYNARAFESANASKVILEKELNGIILNDMINDILCDGETLKSMSENSKNLSKGNASEIIVKEILSLIE